MLTAQQLTKLGEMNGTNEACLMRRESQRSIADTLPARTGVELVKQTLKPMAKDSGELKDGTLLWC